MYYSSFLIECWIDKVFLGDTERENEEDKQLVIVEATLWRFVCSVCGLYSKRIVVERSTKLTKPARNLEYYAARVCRRTAHGETITLYVSIHTS